MTIISVELIPRNIEALQAETKLIKDKFSEVNAINIPDLLRFNTRSWEAVAITSKVFPFSVPHIRAIDFPANDLKNSFEKAGITKHLIENNIPAVLIVKGDEPTDKSIKTYDTHSTDLIKFIKKEFPNIKIYGAIDQYRTTMAEELDYINKKIDNGVDGFFTQPFFDIDLMEKYCNKLGSSEIFWGVSPVTTEASKHYWEKLNQVEFSKDFDLSLDGNIEFAKKALQFVKDEESNIYFMPIRVGIDEYLSGVFS